LERRRLLAMLAGIGAALILAGVALATAAAGGATPPPPGQRPAAGGGALAMPGVLSPLAFDRIAGPLDLSAEQRQAIDALYDQALPALVQLQTRMRTGTARLARTPPDDPGYQGVVASESEAAADAAARLVLQASQLRAQIHGVLTAEQRARLAALEADAQAPAGPDERPGGR